MVFRQYSTGQLIPIDTSFPIASGGEAEIYLISGQPHLLAKVYHKPSEEKAKKLLLMIQNPPGGGRTPQRLALLAWPLDLIVSGEDGKTIVGFLMPRFTGMRPLINYYNPGTRRQQVPLFNYRYLHRTARNLASAFATLHDNGYIVGDVNESNILVSDTAIVALVDTDSFQVLDRSNGLVYRCPVGKPEYTPPELQGKPFSEINRLPEHDRFGLAVLIFQILMEGTHPFAGIFHDNSDPPSYAERIALGHFPYGRKPSPYTPSRTAPPIEILSPKLRNMFIQCFENGHSDPSMRPDAKAWRNAISEAESELVVCSVNSQHLYGKHLDLCPWCERTKLLNGRDPFPSIEMVRSGKHLLQAPRKIVTRPITVQYSPTIYRRTIPQPTFLRRYKHPIWLRIWFAVVLILLIIFFGRSAAKFMWPFITGGQSQKVLSEHNKAINYIDISADGSVIASCSSDRTIKLWDSKTYELIRSLEGHKSGVRLVRFTKDNKLLSFGYDNRLLIWQDQENAKQILEERNIQSVALSHDGNLIAYTKDGRKIYIVDIQSKKLISMIEDVGADVLSIEFSHSNKLIAIGCRTKLPSEKPISTLKVYEVLTGRPLHSQEDTDKKEGPSMLIQEYQNSVRSMAFSPDDKFLAVGSEDNSVSIWYVNSGHLYKMLGTRGRIYRISVLCVDFSPDGRYIAAGSDNNTIRIWSVKTGELTGSLSGHRSWILTLAFSKNGDELISAGRDNTIRIWKTEPR